MTMNVMIIMMCVCVCVCVCTRDCFRLRHREIDSYHWRWNLGFVAYKNAQYPRAVYQTTNIKYHDGDHHVVMMVYWWWWYSVPRLWIPNIHSHFHYMLSLPYYSNSTYGCDSHPELFNVIIIIIIKPTTAIIIIIIIIIIISSTTTVIAI